MDLLVEKLDGSRYYLSQYKVLITDFEESAPSVTRNSKQLDQRNGNIDFGGWHTDKTINITGYYRADDIDEEETLREKLYALLSDPNGYYITQLKTTPSVSMERPGETSGGYYDKLRNYPSHKRFLVYTETPEVELVGNVNGTLLYKLTAEFKTLKLPYGETPPNDIDVKPNIPYYFSDIGQKIDHSSQGTPGKPGADGKTPYLHTAYSWSADGTDRFMTVYPGENLIPHSADFSGYAKDHVEILSSDEYNGHKVIHGSATIVLAGNIDTIRIKALKPSTSTNYVASFIAWSSKEGTKINNHWFSPNTTVSAESSQGGKLTAVDGTMPLTLTTMPTKYWIKWTQTATDEAKTIILGRINAGDISDVYIVEPTLTEGTESSPYIPSPLDDPGGAYPKFIGTYTDYIADDSTDPSKYTWALIKVEDGNDGLSGYNKWYFDTYYNTNNLFIPYSGTVPCNQLEQGFTIELTAKESASSLSFTIDDTELTYSGAVADGDVFIFSGFSYTKNGLSIVSKTNKAYFVLQPDKPNKITCNVPGTVRILGFQNLYA